MFTIEEIMEIGPFSMTKQAKGNLFFLALNEITKYHHENCAGYKKILDVLGYNFFISHAIEKLPFLPVRLFKEHDLYSVKQSEILKTMTSSGTTGQAVSRIFLDRYTALNQTKVLSKIVSDFIGVKRLPMLIIDTKSVLRNRNLFSARGAGILGFSLFGSHITYALDENMELNFSEIDTFVEKFSNEKFLVFGFTSLIWQYFYDKYASGSRKINLENATLIHGGGWKKLNQQQVDNTTFKKSLRDVLGIKKIHNYYGMVEQTGSIFMECEAGYLHCSIFSDICIRDNDFSPCAFKQLGMIELMSLLPKSYPGHVLLSEDLGEVIGEDDCSCGRLGKYFLVHGRIKEAELRGCSDTHD